MRVIVLFLFLNHFGTPLSAQKSTGEGAGKVISSGQQKPAFQITAPAGWDRRDTIMESTFFTFFISPPDGLGDKFRENLNIISEDVGDMAMEEYYENSRLDIYTLPEIKIIDQKDSVINGMDFKILHYSFFTEQYETEALVYITIIKGKSYLITCGCLKGQMKVWQKSFEEIIATFKVD